MTTAHVETSSLTVHFLKQKPLPLDGRMSLFFWNTSLLHGLWLLYVRKSLFQRKIQHTCPSIQFSHSVMSDCLWPHRLKQARIPCPSPTPGVYSNSCPLSQWCHPTISSFVVTFSSHLQSWPASRSFQMSEFFASDGQSIGVSSSAWSPSVLPMNIHDWFSLGWTSWISLLSEVLSRVFSNTAF